MAQKLDLQAFSNGSEPHAFEKLGCHLRAGSAPSGVDFAVWAPNAESVSVIGDFNGWDATANPLSLLRDHGVFTGFVPSAVRGQLYKYAVFAKGGGARVDKADPFGILHEEPPATASVIWDLDYTWGDAAWLAARRESRFAVRPISVYEVHLGSWKRGQGDEKRFLTFREMAAPLADHVERHGFTHVELMPVMEHPFYGSWGYQVTGYFAPTHRYGTPQDLMYLVDYLHQRGIGVIFDWVPAHFPQDAHSLAKFDGTFLFEHEDPRRGVHPDWNSLIFNYGRNEVRSFLMSSAAFWASAYHADGIRFDGVASMLHLDYSRKPGQWIPNIHGGSENLEAVAFLRQLTATLNTLYPDVLLIAEESTAWPKVTRPIESGGLGFSMKWDMGWMHDTLAYFQCDPLYRKGQHDRITFRSVYANSENFMLPLSHDEVVYGKGSLLSRMPGDTSQKFANVRLLFANMWAQPGKKLLFMGGEFAQESEWNHDAALGVEALGAPATNPEWHEGTSRLVSELNRLYRNQPALHEGDFDPHGFEWIDGSDVEQSVVIFLRRAVRGSESILVALNFTPVPRHQYRVGVPHGGMWSEILNTDSKAYGGTGQGNMGGVEATPVPYHGRSHSVVLTLPPLAGVFLKVSAESSSRLRR